MIRTFLMLCTGLLLLVLSESQVEAQYHDNTFYKGKLQLLDKSKLKIGDVSFSDTAVHATNLETNETLLVPYYEINKVKVLGNNRAFWKGVGIGLVCSVVVTTAIVFKDGNPNDIEQYFSGFARTAPLFGFLGGVIGLTFRTYDLVPMDQLQKPKDGLALNPFLNKKMQLGLSIRF